MRLGSRSNEKWTDNDAAMTARGMQNCYDAVRRALRVGDAESALRHMRDGQESRKLLEDWIKRKISTWADWGGEELS